MTDPNWTTCTIGSEVHWSAWYYPEQWPQRTLRHTKYGFRGAWGTLGQQIGGLQFGDPPSATNADYINNYQYAGVFYNPFSLTAEKQESGEWTYPAPDPGYTIVTLYSFPVPESNGTLGGSIFRGALHHGGHAIEIPSAVQTDLAAYFYKVPTHLCRFDSHIPDYGVSFTQPDVRFLSTRYSFITTDEPTSDRAVLVPLPRPAHLVTQAGDIIRKRDQTDSVIRWARSDNITEVYDWAAELWYEPTTGQIYVHHRPIYPTSSLFSPSDRGIVRGSRGYYLHDRRMTLAYGLPDTVRCAAVAKTVDDTPVIAICSLILTEFYGVNKVETTIETRDLELLEDDGFGNYWYGIAWDESIPAYTGTADSFAFRATVFVALADESPGTIETQFAFAPWHRIPPDTLPCAVSAQQWDACRYVPGVLMAADMPT